MNAILEKIENSEAFVCFEIAAEKFEAGIKKAYKKDVKKYEVAGFRKGSVPQASLEAKYGPEIFYETAMDLVVPQAYYDAVEELKLQTVGEPDIEVGYIIKDQAIQVKVRVPVKPEVKLGPLEGLEIKVPKRQAVRDKDIEKQLQHLRFTNKVSDNKGKAAAVMGDTVTLDYEIRVDAAELASKETDVKVLLGSGLFFPGLEDKLIGVKAGDVLAVETSFPQDHPAARLAGHAAAFVIKVKQVDHIYYRELNDQFARDVAQLENLEALRLSVKQKLNEDLERQDFYMKKQAVLQAVLHNCSFAVSEQLVMRQAQEMLERLVKQVEAEGGSLELYLQMQQITFEGLKKTIWEDAEFIIKANYVLEKIVEEKGFEVDEKELDSGIEAFGVSLGMAKANARKENLEPLLEKIHFDLKAEKAVRYLLSHAVISLTDENHN